MNFSINDINRSYSLVRSIIVDPALKDTKFKEKLNNAMDAISKSKAEMATNPETTRKKVIELLQGLTQEVGQTPLPHLKVEKIRAKLLKAQELMKGRLIEKVPSAKIDIKLAFYCDIDSPDHNGAIQTGLTDALARKVPFVTTKSQLLGTKNEKSHEQNLAIQSLLIQKYPDWDIYQQDHPIYGREFLVFLPKSTSLEAFDLNTNGTLKKATLSNLLTLPERKPDFKAFMDLFTEKGTKSKLIYISGHGSTESPAGLSREHYQEFLTFLNHQNCKGVTINSCYAGGKSSLLHLPEEGKTLTFPVIVRSIGDFPTHSSQSAEKRVDLYFDELAALLESDKGATLAQLRKRVQNVEAGNSKVPANLMQVYFPHSADSPGGFRPLGEGGHSYSLTYRQLKSEELMKPKGEIVIRDKAFLELHLPQVDQPLTFEGKDPRILSMIPGDAYHSIREIKLVSHPLDFLRSQLQPTNEMSSVAKKAFFIGELSDGQTKLESVILAPDWGISLFYREGVYYLSDEKNSRPISSLEYGLLLHQILELIEPDQKAVRSQTGGQQISKKWEVKTDFDPFKEEVNREKIGELLAGRSDEELSWLALHFLKAGKLDQAQLFIDRIQSPDLYDWKGRPLICAAAQLAKGNTLIDRLVELKVDVNVKDGNGITALIYAIISGNRPLIEKLLTQENSTINAALFPALTNLELFRLLKSKGANIDIVAPTTGYSLISSACQVCPEKIPELLKEGLNPNLGEPPPLFWAILKQDSHLVQLLLEHGANPLQETKDHYVPAVEAILRSPPEIVQLIFNQKSFDPNLKKHGVTPLLAALLVGNEAYIKTLLDKGALLPFWLGDEGEKFLKFALLRLFHANKDLRMVKPLLTKETSGEIDKQNIFETRLTEVAPSITYSLSKGVREGALKLTQTLSTHRKRIQEAAGAMGAIILYHLTTGDLESFGSFALGCGIFSTFSAVATSSYSLKFLEGVIKLTSSAPLILGEKEFHMALETGKVPDCFVDPVMGQLIENPVIFLDDPLLRPFDLECIKRLVKQGLEPPFDLARMNDLPRLKEQIDAFKAKAGAA